MAVVTVQLDLFGEVEAAESAAVSADRARLTNALICLRDAVPDALQVVVHLSMWRDQRGIGKSGEWAYCVRQNHFRYEAVSDWWNGALDRGEPFGWSRTPAHRVTWAELQTLVGDDPRRVGLIEWEQSLTVVDPWWDLTRPHELWPDPEGWHPSYIESDHRRPGWSARLKAWQDLQALLNDAITRIERAGGMP